MLDYLNAGGALLGGVAAGISVLIASSSIRRREEERLIESLRSVALDANDATTTIDRILNWPLFLEIEELFRARLERFIDGASNVEELDARLTDAVLTKRFPRALQLSIEESQLRRELNDELIRLRKTALSLRGQFPVSGHVLLMCHRLLEGVPESLFAQTDLHHTIMKTQRNAYISQFQEETPENYGYKIATLVSDLPMNHIISKAQTLINQVQVIVRVLTGQLAERDYNALLAQSKREAKLSGSAVDATATITGDIEVALVAIRKNFSDDEWNSIWSAFTLLKASPVFQNE
jgi:hypothetical protein